MNNDTTVMTAMTAMTIEKKYAELFWEFARALVDIPFAEEAQQA